MAAKTAVVRLDQHGHGTVQIDGIEIPGVRAVTVKTEVNCVPVVVLEIVAWSMDVQQGPTAEGVPDAAARQ